MSGVAIVIKYNFACFNCIIRQSFESLDEEEKHFCPKCKKEMVFFNIEEIDDTTGKVIRRESSVKEIDVDKILNTPLPPVVVECPYCHSKRTSKISTFSKVMNIQLGGMYGAIKANKNWQCHDCGSEW